MIVKLKSLLKKLPLIHNFARILYYKIHYLKNLWRGTPAQEKYWATRDINAGNNWIKSYWNNINHPHRLFLIDKISTFYPFSSILEIGSNSGPNLYLLAKKFPNVKISGIDINPMAVQKGNEWFVQEGISNIKLFVGKADKLDQFPDKTFDIVFTDAVLIYIGPDKIAQVITEMTRVAKKAIILLEWHCEKKGANISGLGMHYLGHYKRNYVNLLKRFASYKEIRLTKIPKELWPDKNWQNLGYIIGAIL